MQEELREAENAAETARETQAADARDERIAELERLLAEERYGRAVDGALRGLAFSSASAGRAFAARLAEARLPLEDGAPEGLEAFIAQYRQDDPDAFANARRPVLVRPTGGAAVYTGQAAALRAAFGLR